MNQNQRTYIKVITPLYAVLILSFITMVKTYDSNITWKGVASIVLFIVVLALTAIVIYTMNKKVKS